ncbi:MAG: hypothetical protein ABIP75_03140 [Pyrinomonadaceae bacterium]
MADQFEWIPILTELGEAEVARLIERSPDTADAIRQAYAHWKAAQTEAANLRELGNDQ